MTSKWPTQFYITRATADSRRLVYSFGQLMDLKKSSTFDLDQSRYFGVVRSAAKSSRNTDLAALTVNDVTTHTKKTC